VLDDGNPMHPSVDRLWQLAAERRLTGLEVSRGYRQAWEKVGPRPYQVPSEKGEAAPRSQASPSS
jgi:hypothetical protein